MFLLVVRLGRVWAWLLGYIYVFYSEVFELGGGGLQFVFPLPVLLSFFPSFGSRNLC